MCLCVYVCLLYRYLCRYLLTSNYSYSKRYGQSNSTFNQATNASTSYIQLAQSVDSNNGCYNYGYFYFLGNSGRRSQYAGFSVFERSGDSGVVRFEYGGGNQFDDKSIDAIKIYPNVGTMTGTFKLFGVCVFTIWHNSSNNLILLLNLF